MEPNARERFGLFHVPGLVISVDHQTSLTSSFGKFSDVVYPLLCTGSQEGANKCEGEREGKKTRGRMVVAPKEKKTCRPMGLCGRRKTGTGKGTGRNQARFESRTEAGTTIERVQSLFKLSSLDTNSPVYFTYFCISSVAPSERDKPTFIFLIPGGEPDHQTPSRVV